MAPSYNIVWDPRRRPTTSTQTARPQPQAQQANPMSGVGDVATEILLEQMAEAGLGSGSALAGSAAANAAWNAGASAASQVAATPATQIAWNAAAPEAMSAFGADVAGSAGTQAASSSLAAAAPYMNAAAVVAMPFIMKKLFGGKGIQRPWNAAEIAQDMPGQESTLSKQISGYGALGQDARVALLDKLHGIDKNLIALPGRGKIEGGKLETAKRTPEFVNWARYMTPGGAFGRAQVGRNDKWYDGRSADTPTEDEIKNAHWLTDKKKTDLLGALAAIKGAGQPAQSTNNPLLRRL